MVFISAGALSPDLCKFVCESLSLSVLPVSVKLAILCKLQEGLFVLWNTHTTCILLSSFSCQSISASQLVNGLIHSATFWLLLNNCPSASWYFNIGVVMRHCQFCRSDMRFYSFIISCMQTDLGSPSRSCVPSSYLRQICKKTFMESLVYQMQCAWVTGLP